MTRSTTAAACAAVLASATICGHSGRQTMSSNAYLALQGGTIYVSPGEAPIRNGVVLIRGETIVAVGDSSLAIPETARTIECSGSVVTAAFWNSHVHFFEKKWTDVAAIPAPELRRQLQEMLTRYGFTTVFDLGSSWENTRQLRERIAAGVDGPRILSTGEGLIPPGATPSETVLTMMGVTRTQLLEVANAAEASAASRGLLDRGVDAIKLFVSAPRAASLPERAVRAATTDAHRAGKPVFVHATSSADVAMAIGAGVDVIAHTTPQSGEWGAAVLEGLKERRVALTPTLTLWNTAMRHDRISVQERFTSTAVGQLRAWTAAGGILLFGNDLGAVDYDPTQEYALMTRAGMVFPDVLASLTTTPAAQFGQAQRAGRIAAGFDADLVILAGNPETDIRALANVRYTIRAGRIIYDAGE